MKYSAIVLASTLCACASHNTPPAESAAAVQAATDNPASGPSFAPATNDGEATAPSDHPTNAAAATTAPNGTSPGAATPDAASPSSNASASSSMPYPSNATALPAQSPPPANYEADNTRVNARDRSGTTLTPMDQGSSETDRKLTQQIRQSLVKDSSLSFTAKNVKIITLNGRVTLRGAVKTEAERATISASAKKIAGDAQVENYLEIAK